MHGSPLLLGEDDVDPGPISAPQRARHTSLRPAHHPWAACMQGEMMDPMGGSRQSHHDRHVLTDLTIALLQDTGWCALRLLRPAVSL